ncbi:MAG: hypothetical protein ACRC0A_06640, partial [Chitinophagaceae bacterium]
MQKRIISAILFLFFVIALFLELSGCKKKKPLDIHPPYNTFIDTATLKIKVINPPLASGVDVTLPKTTVKLLLFDSKNLYLSQSTYHGIHTEDTAIVLNGIPMGHYTALLIVDGPGITNLGYLQEGKHGYPEVVDTLQSLLAGSYVGVYSDISYVGVSKTLLVNKRNNEGVLHMQPLYSIISQVTFDLKKVVSAWQQVPQKTDGMAMLLFEDNTYVTKFSVPDSSIKNGKFSIPIAQGANYSFLFVDMIHQDICVLSDSLKKGESSIPSIQSLAERYNNNIRMGMVGTLDIPKPTIVNLNKTTENLSVENCMAEVIFTFPDDMKDIPKPINSEGLVLLEFQNGNLIRQMLIDEDSLKNASFTTQVLKDNNYYFIVVDLLKEDGHFYLSDSLQSEKATINNIQSWVEPYNQNMRMGTITSNIVSLKENMVVPIINGLVNITFDLSALLSSPLLETNQTDGFALLEFKDGIFIKQIDIPYITATNIPDTYTASVVKSTGYSFVFADLIKSTDGSFELKNNILLQNTTLNKMKDCIEPYLNQNIRMGVVAIANLNTTPTTNPIKVNSLIQSVKVNLAGNIGCTSEKEWTTAINWAILVLDHTGFYKRTVVANVNYQTLSTTPFNVWKGNPYTLAVIGEFGSTSLRNFQNNTTTYNYIKNNINNIQPHQYAWLATDSGITTEKVSADHILTINATTNILTNAIQSYIRMDRIPVNTISQLRALGKGYSNFGCNPIKITGIVTTDGSGENDIKDLIILQDKMNINAAIPIQFNTPTGLKKGDQVTIVIQDGNLERNNINANNMLVLENVTYTKDPSTAIVPNQSVSVLSLGDITSLTEDNIAPYEAMLVSVNHVEFRYWKGQTYYDLIHLNPTVVDFIELRDANVNANTPTSKRAKFRLKMNTSLSQISGFGFQPIPVGKGKVVGILAKNSTNQYAIQPRDKNDIFTDNNVLNRVDKGVVVQWIGYHPTLDYNLISTNW